MTDNLGTVVVDPVRLVWLQWALDFWQEANTAESTKKLRSWCKKYCAEDAPEAPDEPEEKAEADEE